MTVRWDWLRLRDLFGRLVREVRIARRMVAWSARREVVGKVWGVLTEVMLAHALGQTSTLDVYEGVKRVSRK